MLIWSMIAVLKSSSACAPGAAVAVPLAASAASVPTNCLRLSWPFSKRATRSETIDSMTPSFGGPCSIRTNRRVRQYRGQRAGCAYRSDLNLWGQLFGRFSRLHFALVREALQKVCPDEHELSLLLIVCGFGIFETFGSTPTIMLFSHVSPKCRALNCPPGGSIDSRAERGLARLYLSA